MKFMGMLIIYTDLVRTASVFPQNCQRPGTFLHDLHTGWLVWEITLLPSQNISAGTVHLKAERTFL